MGINRLFATKGMILTNGKVCGKSISLGVNDSIDNWWEITEAEYNASLVNNYEE